MREDGGAKRSPIFLREWREARGLSLSDMAKLIPFGKSTMSRVETGKIPYYQDILEAYAKIVGCSPADLITSPPGDVDELWRVLGPAPPHIRRQIADIAKIIMQSRRK